MKRRWWRYFLIGVVTYAVVLVAKLPAAVAYPYLQSALQPVVLSGLAGSVWSGSAAGLRYQRQVVGKLRWSLRPLSLLSGEIGADVAIDGPFGQLQGIAGVDLAGEGFLENFTGTLSAADIAPSLQLQATRPEGRIELAIERLELLGRIPVYAAGEVIWHQARIALPQPIDVGTFAATLSTDADGVRAALRDRDSPLVLDAVLSLKSDGNYRVSGRVSAKSEAPSAIHDLLRNAGVRQQGGALPLNISGRFR